MSDIYALAVLQTAYLVMNLFNHVILLFKNLMICVGFFINGPGQQDMATYFFYFFFFLHFFIIFFFHYELNDKYFWVLE